MRKIKNACVYSVDRMQTYRMLGQMMFIITNVNCALLGYYAATTGDFLQTFRVYLSVLSSGVKNPKKKPVVPVRGLYREECGR
jgi:hypothetical protein